MDKAKGISRQCDGVCQYKVTMCYDRDEPGKYYAKRRKPVTKSHMLCFHLLETYRTGTAIDTDSAFVDPGIRGDPVVTAAQLHAQQCTKNHSCTHLMGIPWCAS